MTVRHRDERLPISVNIEHWLITLKTLLWAVGGSQVATEAFFRAMAFMQYRKPEGGGPSGKT